MTKKYLPWVLSAVWLAAVGMGIRILLVYDFTPGADTHVPVIWPVETKIPHAAGKPVIVLFAHPNCPCTRASIGELAVLMTDCRNQVNAHVVFFRPKGSRADWVQTDLWRSAAAIPGVVVQADEGGEEAGRFQVTTSGSVVLFDEHQRLVFHGGITSARGHSGDNDGRSAITKLLRHEVPADTQTPVFGCSLLNPKPGCDNTDSVCTR